MKNTWLATIFLLFLMVSFFLNSIAHATGPRVAPNLFSSNLYQLYALEFPPYITTHTAKRGLLFELIDTVLKQQNIAAEINILPSQNMVKYYYNQETALAMIGHDFNLNKQQQNNSLYIPVLSIKEYFFYYYPAYKDGFEWKGNLSAFKNKIYGANKGDDVDVYLKAGVKVKYSRLHALIAKLRSQDIDFIRESELTVNSLIESSFPNEEKLFIKMQPEAGFMSLGIMFNIQHKLGKESAGKFKQGLKQLKNSDQYKMILNKYRISN